MSLLDISVAEGEFGPVVILSGEADLTTLARLDSALDAQLGASPQLLTVDLSWLRFADSAAVGALVRAARTLRGQGGQLELRHPQPTVARLLSLLGVDQYVTVRDEPESGCRAATE